MPRNRRTFGFTDRAIRGLPLPPKPQQLDYFDATLTGLGVRVSYGGTRSFFILYGPAAKRRRHTLGEFGRLEDGKLSLAEARRQAKAHLGGVAGKTADPAGEARAARKAATCATIATDYIAAQVARGRKSWRRQEAILKRDVLPAIGAIKGCDLTRGDVKACLRKIAERPAPVLANRAHEVVRAMLNWGLLQDEYGLAFNAADKIERRPERARERFLSEAELGAYWKAIDSAVEAAPLYKPGRLSAATRAGADLAARRKADALRLCMLTAQRQANVLAMHESQLMLADSLWLVPADTTKTARTYRVPLSRAAVAIIRERLAEARGGWLFPNDRGDGPIGANSVWHRRAHEAVCRAAGIKDYTLHDHRHSFATHADALEVPRLIWDAVLGHAANGMADLYSGHDFAERRRDCMERWAARIMAAAGENVVRLVRDGA